MNDEIKRMYFKTSDISKMCGVNNSTIRWWQSQFNIPVKKISHAKNVYTRKAVAQFHIIHNLLRVEKFTIEGAKQKFKLMPK